MEDLKNLFKRVDQAKNLLKEKKNHPDFEHIASDDFDDVSKRFNDVMSEYFGLVKKLNEVEQVYNTGNTLTFKNQK